MTVAAGGAKARRMTDRPDPVEARADADANNQVPKPGKLAARQEREAAAWRANLRKRKDQARAREKPQQE